MSKFVVLSFQSSSFFLCQFSKFSIDFFKILYSVGFACNRERQVADSHTSGEFGEFLSIFSQFSKMRKLFLIVTKKSEMKYGSVLHIVSITISNASLFIIRKYFFEKKIIVKKQDYCLVFFLFCLMMRWIQSRSSLFRCWTPGEGELYTITHSCCLNVA